VALVTFNGRTSGKQPTSSAAVLIDAWTRVFPIGSKAFEIEVEYLLIMQDGLSGGERRDWVDLGQDQSRQGESGILTVSVKHTLSETELSLHLQAR
jgi:hypothetical protein